MTGEVIKSFLVGLGFGVDEESLSKFNKSIASATLKVTALYASIKLTAAGIVAGISKISEGFEQMGYEYRIIAPAINKTLLLRRELLKAYDAAGINITKVIQSSVKLNFSLTKTKYAFEAIYRSVASRFFDQLTKSSDVFRQKIYANMPKIQAALERFVKFIFKAVEATTALGLRLWSILTRVLNFFVELDRATNGWSTIILGVIAAWKLLNLEFLATPLGMLLTGLVAILALLDDFLTWKEGGKSLFDWSSFVPVIDAVTGALSSLWKVLQSIADVLASVLLGFYQLFQGDTDGFFQSMADAGKAVVAVFMNLWETVKGIGGSLSSLGTWADKLSGGLFSGLATGDFSGKGAPTSAPLGVGNSAGQNQTNQNVHQQTNINVQGVADANAVGKAVSGEQGKVNFDLVRNLKGATR